MTHDGVNVHAVQYERYIIGAFGGGFPEHVFAKGAPRKLLPPEARLPTTR